ncbi:uncharacterized protein PG998_011153 [Apiospora kogelbergensis]|uniref:uncharacterized protein n=1 Tax=Apiospora kogelbergensis TaxID=1337665 RepID=UPI00312CD7A2
MITTDSSPRSTLLPLTLVRDVKAILELAGITIRSQALNLPELQSETVPAWETGQFGWNPIFEYEGETYANIDPAGTNNISHRSRTLNCASLDRGGHEGGGKRLSHTLSYQKATG